MDASDDTGPALPARIGPYRPLRVLGEGAQGRVYLAEQEHPRREVALKVLRRGGLAADARFQREIALLARLEHPGIARLYEAGEEDLADGRVAWFAMEYVRGAGLAEHARGLDLRQRLALVAAIGHAVHHAHVQGVVHRDLKPANILVDGTGQPKVLDFGMAQATQAEATRMTAAGQVVGTIAYMAPEALSGDAGGGARADVYALGVIAYELLGGALPYPDLSRSSLVEAIRRVSAGRPRPLGEALPAARGDVETIVMKAIAGEPAQRYASAAEFASDIERFLAGAPITARPPTAGYLLGLFVRRHRLVSALAAALVLAVLVGAGVSLRYALAERESRQQAEARAGELLAVNGFLRDMLTGADPFHTRGRDLTVRELLDGARQSLERDRRLSPAAQASLYEAIGGTYLAIGESEAAATLLDGGRQRLQTVLPADDLAARGLQRAWLAAQYGAGKSAELLDASAALLAAWPASTAATPPDERRTRLLAVKLRAQLLAELSRYDEALPLVKAARAEARAALPPDDVLIYQLGQDEVALLRFMGRGEDSTQAARTLLAEESAALGADHPLTFSARHELAWIAQEQGRYDDAEREVIPLIADLERVYGREHYSTQHSLNLLALLHLRRGDFAKGEALAREVTATNTERLGPNHPETLAARGNLATATWKTGKHAEAEALYRQNIAGHQATGHGEQSDAIVARNNLARLLTQTGRIAEAATLYEECLAMVRKVMGEQHPHYALLRINYSEVLLLLKRPAEALALLESARPQVLAAMGPQSPFYKSGTERMALAYRQLGREADAARVEAELKPAP